MKCTCPEVVNIGNDANAAAINIETNKILKISIIETYISFIQKYIKGAKNMGYPKKHRGRRKIGSKKRRARKRNKRK